MRTQGHFLLTVLLFYPLAVSSPRAPAELKSTDDDWIYSAGSVLHCGSDLPSFEDVPEFNRCLSYGQLQLEISYDLLGLQVPPNDLLRGFRLFVALFTLLGELESASSDAEYADLQTQLQSEWLKVGGVLLGLIAVNLGVLALTPDSLLGSTNTITRISLAGGSIASAAGLLCDAYVLLRFSRTSIQAFKRRAEDGYRLSGSAAGPLVTTAPTYIAFAVLARLPLVLVLFATTCIAVLLGAAAYELSAPITLSVLGVVAAILSLRYLIWALVWVVFTFSRIWITGASMCEHRMGRLRGLFDRSGA
ncbi:hypothetical protein B0H16DRAFT_1683448 [Mycena metata]|uniref:Uncharacterized protein n=1 Tax=Mycena metata TaxID=1033252 RepID=A0AAD7K494_9AGAR|nr:hypothetical protein B0H16DRAFT_1683448 [Mycena metata]